MTRPRRVLGRRTLLRGAGSVAIALPLLDEMIATSAWGGPPPPPVRAINVFFGLGVPPPIAAEGLVGPLAPLAAFADKLAIVRGVNLHEADGTDDNHYEGGAAAFTAVEPPSHTQAGGPSLDQVLRTALPSGRASTLVQTLMMGSFFRRKRTTDLALSRFVHCWNADGSAVDLPIETPAALFERIFGIGPIGDAPADVKARHYERSVLDGVIAQYEHLTGEAGGLGAASRSRIADHLERIRELERKLLPDPLACEAPPRPGDVTLLQGQDPDGAVGPTLDPAAWAAWWRTLVDLYVLALRCDVARFGMIEFQSAGERLQLVGSAAVQGEAIAFDDLADPIGVAGSHEYWHVYDASAENAALRRHLAFTMEQLAYVLAALDDPAFVDPDGGTLLDNALVTIATELGDGAPHDLTGVFHAVSCAGGRFVPGLHDVSVSGTELYTTLVRAMGVDRIVGTPAAYRGDVAAILA